MTRRARWTVVAVAALVAAAALAVWIWHSGSRPTSPTTAAERYLRALESADSAGVRELMPDVPEAALRALESAGEPIEDASVLGVHRNASTAIARVRFTAGAADHEARIALTETSGRWTIDGSTLAEVTAIPTIGDSLALGDAEIPASESVRLLPAVYEIVASPVEFLEGSAVVSALPGEPTRVDLDVALRPAATDEAQRQLEEHLDDCASSPDAAPVGCGIRIPWGTDLRTVSAAAYRIESMPVVALDDDGFTANAGVLVATLDGTALDGSARSTTYRTESWSVRGDVDFAGDEMVLTVW